MGFTEVAKWNENTKIHYYLEGYFQFSDDL